MKSTNRATAFSRRLRDELNKEHAFNKRIGVTQWIKNKGFGEKHRETVDVVGLGKDGSLLLLIEVELLREDPASNVVKIWKWIKDRIVPKNVVMIQAFSRAYYKKPHSDRRKSERRERAEFLGKRMMKEFPRVQYKAIPFGYSPRPRSKKGGGARDKRAKELAHLIRVTR
jgi:hypothetical protein